jgi:hypothetical protein
VYLPDPSNLDRKRPYLLEHTISSKIHKMSTKTSEQEDVIVAVIYELHVLEDAEDAEYRSFAIASTTENNQHYSRIISNGKIYLPTPIDPLFWFVSAFSVRRQQQKQQQAPAWQPIPQFLESSCQKIPAVIRQMVPLEQLCHIVKTMRIDNGEDDKDGNDEKKTDAEKTSPSKLADLQHLYYCKFDEMRILQWLQAKQLAVQKVLSRQQQHRALRQTLQHQKQQNGAFCDNFHLTSSPVTTTTTTVTPSSEQPPPTSPSISKNNNNNNDDIPVLDAPMDDETCRIESIQIVSEYLDEFWRCKFWEASGVTPEQVLEETTTTSLPKKRSQEQIGPESYNNTNKFIMAENGVENDHPVATTATKNTTTTTKSNATAITTGAKRLAKVNTKGIPKMSSFFTAKKKK